MTVDVVEGAAEGGAEGTAQAAAATRRDERATDRRRIAEGLHELRTPLATIRGSLETLRTAGSDLPASIRDDLLALALRNAIRLGSRLDTLADAERMHEPATWLRPVRHSLAQIVQRTTSDCADLLAEHALVVDVPDDLQVSVDAEALVHVLSTLLDNATRHSPPGTTVRVGATRLADLARVEVRDDGPGISPEQLPQVFAALHGDSGPVDPVASLGLGVVRRFVEASGGAVHLRVRPDEGTTVRFTLPLAAGG